MGLLICGDPYCPYKARVEELEAEVRALKAKLAERDERERVRFDEDDWT